MTQIEGGHVVDRVGAVPGPDSVNKRVSGPGTELDSVQGLARLKWAICKRGLIDCPETIQLHATSRSLSSMGKNW